MIRSKQHIDEIQYYTDFADLEVSYDNSDEFELYDSSDESFIERDHLDIMEFCKDLHNVEVLDDNMFNFLEV